MMRSIERRPSWRAKARRAGLRPLGSERGIALPMVLLVFVLSVALVGAFMTAIAGSIQVSTTTKSGLQAQQAAEAGVDATLARLSAAANPCSVGTVTGTTPRFTATAVCSGSPVDRVTVVSAGTVGEVTQRVETVVSLQSSAPPPGRTALRTGDGLEMNGGFKIEGQTPSDPADVYVESGDLDCGSGTGILGNVYVAAGKALISGACPIAENLVVQGDVTITGSGAVGGDVVSLSGSVKLQGGATVKGSVFTKLDLIRTNGKIEKDAVVGRNVSLSGGAPAVAGTLRYGGTKSLAWGGDADWVRTGTPVRMNTDAITRPQLPPIDPWVNLTLPDIKAQGFAERAWSGSCNIPSSPAHAFFTSTIPGYTSKTVVNALSCNPLQLTDSGGELKIKTALVIVAKRINLNNVRINSADGQPHTIWFVVPSDQTCLPPFGPTSTKNKNAIELQNTVKFPDGKISAMVYTTCGVNFFNAGNDPWPGSVYAKRFFGYAGIKFSPVQLPGHSSTPGGPGGPSGAPMLGQVVSQRNID